MATKIIKEIVTDVGGNTTIEYSDDTVQKYNVADVVTAQANPVTGGIAFSGDLAAQQVTFARGEVWANVRRILRAEFAKSASGGLGHIGFGGDSTGAGVGATNSDNFSIGGSLRSILASKGVPSAGTGLVTQYRESGASPMWSGSGWSDFGRITNMMSGSTARTFTSDKAGTVVSVMYGNSGVSFDVAIDGAAAVRVTSNTSDTFGLYTVTGLSNATHTVVITPVSGISHIYAAEVRNASGLRVSNFGIGGARSADLFSSSSWFHTLKAVVSSGVKVYFVRAAVNDIGGGVSQATTIANMLSGMAYLRANAVEPVLLSACYWQDNDAVIKSHVDALVAAAVSAGYAAFDSRQTYGTYAQAQSLGFTTDALHPSNTGYAQEAMSLSEAI